MERSAGAALPLPSPCDLLSLHQTDRKRCDRGAENQLRVNAYQNASCENWPINGLSAYGLLKSRVAGDEWKQIPYRSKVQSGFWLSAVVCVFVF